MVYFYETDSQRKQKGMCQGNLKAHFHGLKYVDEIVKLLPKKPDAILMNELYSKITTIGAIEEVKKVA